LLFFFVSLAFPHSCAATRPLQSSKTGESDQFFRCTSSAVETDRFIYFNIPVDFSLSFTTIRSVDELFTNDNGQQLAIGFGSSGLYYTTIQDMVGILNSTTILSGNGQGA
jgi:hypothetical protein